MNKNVRPETLIWDLARAYMSAKERVIESGYAHEIDWQDTLSFDFVTESYFLREAAWVVLSSGMRESVIRKKFPAISVAFLEWRSAGQIVNHQDECREAALASFNNQKKIDAIIKVAAQLVETGFECVKRRVWEEGIGYITQFPYMGPATSYHFAKNLGLPTAKPDRHLNRIAKAASYNTPQAMCVDIAEFIGDKVAVVDLVMWRYATLEKDYLNLFRPIRTRGTSPEDWGFCWLDNDEQIFV